MNEQQEVIEIIKWKSPWESHIVLNVLKTLPVNKLEVAMEPTGTYGDPLSQLLDEQGIATYLINPKRSHDAIEVYDGVPSSHDAKSAVILAKLHLDGLTRRWRPKTVQERIVSVVVAKLSRYKKHYLQSISRLEASLARYWPEIGSCLALTAVTLLTLLQKFGEPRQIAIQAKAAYHVMEEVGGRMLSEGKKQAILQAAKETVGVAMIPAEREGMQDFAAEILCQRKTLLSAERELRKWVKRDPQLQVMGTVVGRVTAGVLYAKVGHPQDYPSAKAYVKGLGLNLKTRESGKSKGKLKITKRGSSIARTYLYFAAMRYIYREPIFKAWYDKKVKRQGGQLKNKAVVALMRKLGLALWHVSRGERFDARKLFDTRRLHLPPSETQS
jgi:transposase